MKFTITTTDENITALVMHLGYRRAPAPKGEFAFVRSVAGMGFPRFHLYVKEDSERRNAVFNLHLDQKKPSYRGARAHGGEYDGVVLEAEVDRIKILFEKR